MRLQNGEIAPNFNVQDMNGNSFDLLKPRSKPLLIAFFRYASCPLCNLRVHELIENYERLKEKIEIVLIFQSPKEKIEQYVGKQDIPYRVLPNPSKTLYHLYGVENSWLGFAKAWTIKIKQVFVAVLKNHYLPGSVEGEIHRIPADFVVGQDNKILKVFYGKDIGDHLPLEELDSILKREQK
ncbi:MAG TPA: AhpC/TSA family protein [Epsilonproteobacteria bacterium]|nr:AhpC/TSA family protein [Campylobacterota bacterium]